MTKDGSDRRSMERLFMRIDIDSDGVVDWNEFVSFMLLENRTSKAKENAKPQFCIQPFSSEMNDAKASDWRFFETSKRFKAHFDTITSICNVSVGSGYIVSGGKDGKIIAWKRKANSKQERYDRPAHRDWNIRYRSKLENGLRRWRFYHLLEVSM